MEKSSFFNSVNGDRKYQASDFAAYFSKFIGNGVFPNPSTNLQVIANNDMTVTVKAGPGWINGYMYLNDSDLILPIEVADGVLNRIDRIALRMDTAGRAINAVIKKGTFASSPVAPTLQRDADGYELGVADVYVGAGVTSISQANITDKRYDSSLCGISSGLIQQVDVSTLFNQYSEGFQSKEVDFENEFNTWFDTIKNQLSGDVAGNLQNQINTLNDTVTSHEANNVTQFATKLDKADYVRAGGYAVTAGTSTAYTITLSPAPTTYVDGQQFLINPHVDCGATPTLNVNGIGTGVILKQDGSAVLAGDIKANIPLALVRVGSNFFICSGIGGSNIKNIYSGVITKGTSVNYIDVPISSVDINKSIVTCSYSLNNVGSGVQGDRVIPKLSFVNSTTIRIETVSTGCAIDIAWVVIEFQNIKSLQGVASSLTSNTLNLNISQINLAKSALFFTFNTNSISSLLVSAMLKGNILDSSTIQFYTNVTATFNIQCFVVEFN